MESQPVVERKVIPLKDKIMLGPIDKYRKYNRFPWKFIIHVVLLFLTAFQVVSLMEEQEEASFLGATLWDNVFMTDAAGNPPDIIGGTIRLFDVTSVNDFVTNTVNNYYDINQASLFDYYTQPTQLNG